MGRLILFVIGYLIVSTCYSQQDSVLRFQLQKTVTDSVVDFTIDNLGNLFIINANNQIKKRNANGDSVGVFNDVRKFGKVFSIDASNPLKVLVYYKDFGTIVVLDRFLNIRNTIDLRQTGILQVSAIAQSYDNNIWLFDELDNKIKKLDELGKLLSASVDFRMLFDETPSPQLIYDRDGLLYVYDIKKGLLIFDYYGGLKNNIALPGINDLQVQDKKIITGRDSTSIIHYQPAQLKLNHYKFDLNAADLKKLRLSNNTAYVLNNKKQLQIYRIK